YGEYNQEAGRFIMGRETALAKFQIGTGSGSAANTSEAHFSVKGGSAKIWGDLEIGVAGGTSTVGGAPLTSYATGTVTVTGGTLDVSGQIKFGRGLGRLNLNGRILVLNSANPILNSATSTLSFNGGTLSTRTPATT